MTNRWLFLLLISLVTTVSFAKSDRWYTDDQVTQGDILFQQNCAACHGQNAQGTTEWKTTDANGNYPPPPLDGTAHTWHHDLTLLKSTIKEGGKKLGGVMPGFEGRLSERDIDRVIAFFQSKWPDELYQKWAERFEVSADPSLGYDLQDNSTPLTQRLRKLVGNAPFGKPEKTPVEGIWQVKFQNKHLYLVDGGKYAIAGDFINLETGQNLTSVAQSKQAIAAISNYADNDLVVFMPQDEVKATLNIFTDTSCPYCQKLHKELPQLSAAGIKVRYLPFARGGEQGPGYQTLKSVWCAKDRKQAMTDAKNQNFENLPSGDCEAANIIDQAYETGIQVGITGTPALFKQNGEKIDGYVPYQKLIPMVLN